MTKADVGHADKSAQGYTQPRVVWTASPELVGALELVVYRRQRPGERLKVQII